jgi:hypothetical protein
MVRVLGFENRSNLKKIPAKAYSWTFKGEDGAEFLMEIRITKIA